MKKTLSLVFMLAVVMNASAAGYGESSGFLTFIGIVMLVFGILQIVLFFKLWGMTNDIREIKKEFFKEDDLPEDIESKVDALKTSLILGNKELVKSIFLKKFISRVERNFSRLPKGKDSLDKSIEKYVEQLDEQFERIGEDLPVYIENMKTYRDYYDLITKEDLIIRIKK